MSASTTPRRTALALGLLLVVAALDQLTKQWALAALTPHEPVALIGSWLRWWLVFNPGAAFSFGTGSTWIFTLAQAAGVIVCVVLARSVRYTPWAVALGLVGGGAAGNLLDRLLRPPGVGVGHVVDFISVGWWPIFNLADSAVVCGMALVAWLLLRDYDFSGHRRSR